GYQLRANQRGRSNVGPVSVETRDPFGMVRLLRQQHSGETSLAVTPVISRLSGTVLGAINGADGEATPQRISSSGEDDVLVREYRHGDDMRRVHWRSSAKLGELMVRREERAGGPSATILLDSRQSAHAGQGPDSSFEWSVNAAASIAMLLLEYGYHVCLVSAEGTLVEPRLSTAEQELAREDIMSALTDITMSAGDSLDAAADALSHHSDNHVLIALIGRTSHHNLERILTARHGRTRGLAFAVDTPSFTADKTATEGVSLDQRCMSFSGNGWRTVAVTSAMSVPQAWLGVRNLA
ncbi:MAG: DUF58 domain-containing protein, partial [Propionibacteriaceae bacterium]